ncbi:hypothetical protein J6590_012171 [Homalodisca vitripennis]|nr:hypothetical protein J6590_012171 [Homalodisca vitripennis]
MSLGDQLSLSTLPHVLLTVSDESWRSAQFIYAPHVLLTVSDESWRPGHIRINRLPIRMYRTRKISSDELAAICHVAQSRNVAQGHHDRLRYYMHYGMRITTRVLETAGKLNYHQSCRGARRPYCFPSVVDGQTEQGSILKVGRQRSSPIDILNHPHFCVLSDRVQKQ